MAELIEMPFGWAQGTIYHMGVQIPQGKWATFWGCLTAAVHVAKINNGISANAAADCTAPNWPVSH